MYLQRRFKGVNDAHARPNGHWSVRTSLRSKFKRSVQRNIPLTFLYLPISTHTGVVCIWFVRSVRARVVSFQFTFLTVAVTWSRFLAVASSGQSKMLAVLIIMIRLRVHLQWRTLHCVSLCELNRVTAIGYFVTYVEVTCNKTCSLHRNEDIGSHSRQYTGLFWTGGSSVGHLNFEECPAARLVSWFMPDVPMAVNN